MGHDPDLTPHRRGRGRPRKLNATQVHYARRAHAKGVTVVLLAAVLGCSRSTVLRELRRA